MSSDSILQVSTRTEQQTSLDRWARNAGVALLRGIRSGRLIIEHEGEVLEFGEPARDATLIAHVHVHHSRVFRRMMLNGTVGAAESYIQGDWSSPDLLRLIRLMVLNLSMLGDMNSKRSLWNRLNSHWLRFVNRNSLKGSRDNIRAHYDLGNDFFALFLDPTMMYSSGMYPAASSSLHEASLHKLERICQKLELRPDDHVIEIGSGWGGFALYAARHYGCRVTTTTLSREQYDYACQQVEKAQLSDRITVLLKDYRQLEGRYDKLVSIEMIEAVGHRYYDSYFSKCSSLLKDDGLMLIQAITISDQRYQSALQAVDFIQKYIFPGGCLPCNTVVTEKLASNTDMQLIGLEDITLHYARTLRDWRNNFVSQTDRVSEQGFSDDFIRMWEYYLAYCEGGFSERVIHCAHFLMAKPAYRSAMA